MFWINGERATAQPSEESRDPCLHLQVFAERHTPVHQIRPHILPQIHQPTCETGFGGSGHSL